MHVGAPACQVLHLRGGALVVHLADLLRERLVHDHAQHVTVQREGVEEFGDLLRTHQLFEAARIRDAPRAASTSHSTPSSRCPTCTRPSP
ncbi:hypothetical protein [Streptomyces globosus]|uniref:hypothetical protein n=1 Tax=Streptomyces globosus TaxID=68209 RepID=UPI0031E2C887